MKERDQMFLYNIINSAYTGEINYVLEGLDR